MSKMAVGQSRRFKRGGCNIAISKALGSQEPQNTRKNRRRYMALAESSGRRRFARPSASRVRIPSCCRRQWRRHYRNRRKGLRHADMVMRLRLQRERMTAASCRRCRNMSSLRSRRVKLTPAKLDALMLKPGPMNRGVEISSTAADGAQSLVREQVEMGVAVRMAVPEALEPRHPAERVRSDGSQERWSSAEVKTKLSFRCARRASHKLCHGANLPERWSPSGRRM